VTTVRGDSRKLAGLEYAMRLSDDVAPFNVVCVLRIKGNLPVQTLRGALDELQRRHRFLRARIITAGKDYFFHFDVEKPIALDVKPRSGPEHWKTAAQETLHQPFDLAAGPLVRCLYLHDQSGVDLLLTVHHSVIDGASAVYLIGELLALCAGQAPDVSSEAAAEGTVPATELFPKEFTGLRMARAIAAFGGRSMAEDGRFRWNSRGVRKQTIAKSGKCQILPVRFSSALTAKLVQSSHRHKITLNAILGAAMMSAVQRRLYPSPRVPLWHITFADLRPRLREPVPNSRLGCFLTMFRFTAMVTKGGDFWALAQDIQDSTARAARSGERYLNHFMAPAMFKLLFGLKPFRMAASTLSYFGPVDLPASHGSFEVTGLHAFVANFTIGPEFSALARLFRGELWCDVMYLDSDMDEAGAQAIANEMQMILEEATR